MAEEAKWYVVHTYSGYENKVKADIEKTIENRNLQDQILEVLIPLQTVVEEKNGEKKQVQNSWDEKIAAVEEIVEVVKEAHWLCSKFGEGKYEDILGLCKIADIETIENKGWSLTPGAYVGVAPVEDDGVDFEERMAEIHQELLSLQAESNDLMDTISQNMKEMGL